MRDTLLEKVQRRMKDNVHPIVSQKQKSPAATEKARPELAEQRYQQSYIPQTPALPAGLSQNPQQYLQGLAAASSRPVLPAQPNRRSEQHEIPADCMGYVIGRGGKTLQQIRADTACRIQAPLVANTDQVATLTLTGKAHEIQAAKQAIDNLVAQKRGLGGSRGTRGAASSPVQNARRPTQHQGAMQQQQSSYDADVDDSADWTQENSAGSSDVAGLLSQFVPDYLHGGQAMQLEPNGSIRLENYSGSKMPITAQARAEVKAAAGAKRKAAEPAPASDVNVGQVHKKINLGEKKQSVPSQSAFQTTPQPTEIPPSTSKSSSSGAPVQTPSDAAAQRQAAIDARKAKAQRLLMAETTMYLGTKAVDADTAHIVAQSRARVHEQEEFEKKNLLQPHEEDPDLFPEADLQDALQNPEVAGGKRRASVSDDSDADDAMSETK